MLHPRNNLVLVEMENVAKEDIELASGPETFLGVDLTEYYGGSKSDTAERIVVVQVKYSPTHQTERWTLARLCADKVSTTGSTKPGTSVLRKLANAFNAFYSKLGDATPDKVEIRLHTNQRLSEPLQGYLEQTKALLKSQKDAKVLQQQSSADLRVILEELLSTTRLSWKRLAAFIKCWNLSSFGQAMLSEAEGELFTVANQYRSDSDLYIDRLISFIQDHASSNRPTEITREKVYAQLRLREEDFFPAPQCFEPISALLFTDAAQRVIKEIDHLRSGFLLVHGVTGTGKSTTLRLVSQHYGEGRATVIYDCYAGGAGLQLGSERFPADKCFVQVINELDSLMHTNVLATTRLNTYNLISQFNQALERAAQLAAQRGHRLVVAFDAVDNAVAAASRSPLKGEHSFVPMLWRIRCPQNCVIIASARTENLAWLNVTCDYRQIPIGGFLERETEQYVRSFWHNASDTLVKHIHERTKGNPRVQSKLIEAATREPSKDLFKLVDEKAKETAFEYYLEACPERLASDDDRLILGVLLEAAPPLTLQLLADILAQPLAKVRTNIDSLYFGLRVEGEERISWADQDFFDFATEFAAGTISRARQLVDQYCRQGYETSTYARVNLSRHLFLAGEYDDLVNWWLRDDRLVKRIAETTPHEEDVLTDVQYALLAAINVGRLDDALRLLAIAADIKQGRDVFSTEVMSHLDAAIECGYLERLLESLNRENAQDLPSSYFGLARSLITHGGEVEFVKDLISRGTAIIEQDRTVRPHQGGGFSLGNVLNIEVAHAGIEGFGRTLTHLERWTPQETVLSVYGSLARVCSKGRGEETLASINCVTLTSQRRAYTLIGLLSARDAGLSEASIQLVADEVQKSCEDGLLDWEQAMQFLPGAILNLLRNGLQEKAKKLLPYWQIRPPYYQHDPNIFAFAKIVSLRTALEVENFDPDQFQVERPGGSKPTERLSPEDDHMSRNLRDEMKKLLPGTLCWARALSGGATDEEVLTAVEDVLRQWEVDVDRWWYEPQFSFIEIAVLLLEAITGLQAYHKETVAAILNTADRVLRGTSNHGYERYAETLSYDPRYHAQAEELVQKRRAEVHPPAYRASEAVQALLDLYAVAARLDRDLAFDVFTDARLAASEWDGNIGGRASALLRTVSHAQSQIRIDDDHLTKLATVFEYMKQVAFDDTYSGLEEALRLIARVRPSFAFAVLTKLEQSSLLDFDDGIGPISLGMLDAGHAPSQAIWPLAHLVILSEKVREVFYEVIPQVLAEGESVDSVLKAFALHLRTAVPRDVRAMRAEEFVQKAEKDWGLGTHPVTRRMHNFASELGALTGARADSLNVTQTHSPDLTSPLLEAFLGALERSPLAALEVLTQANNDDIRGMRGQEVSDVVKNMAEVLPSVQIVEFFGFIEKWSSDRLVPESFDFIIQCAEGMAARLGPSSKVVTALTTSLERMLTPVAVSQLSRAYYRSHLERILDCTLLALEVRLKIVLSAMGKSLKELTADEIYWLVGNLGERLTADQSFSVFDTLLDRAVHKLPEAASFEKVKIEEPYKALVRFLSNLLGDPRQIIRWRTVYALIDMALNVPEPSLALLVQELQDDSHPRWITKREWVLFVLHHISLRIPSLLESYRETFVRQLFDSEFPHAKIRYQLREILLNIEKNSPGLLQPEVAAEIRAVNEPKGFKPRIYDLPSDKTQAKKKGSLNSTARPAFTFDSMDTLPYWYAPLANCFAAPTAEVSDIAYKWIVEVWGITDESCRIDRQSRRYSWEDSSHSHGSEPAVETLKLYAERHGMFMAAGELIASEDVVKESEREGDAWHHWVRYHLRAADPALTGRLLDAPPAVGDNYGKFSTDFEEWRKKKEAIDFCDEVFTSNKADWIVVAGYREGNFGQRSFHASIKSALVSRQTSAALARCVDSTDEFVNLPDVDAYYSTILPEFESDLIGLGDYYLRRENEIEEHQGLFRLKAFIVDWHQEMPFHTYDPKWAEHGRNFHFPVNEFVTNLGLQRDPLTLHWQDSNGNCVAFHESWYDHEGRRENYEGATGHRLLVRRDALVTYLNIVDLDLILIVDLARQLSYQYRNHLRDAEEREYDRGTKRAFVLTHEGTLRGRGIDK